MFETKKLLKKKITDLEKELRDAKDQKYISAFIDSSDLPKCKSLACIGCEHMIFHEYHCHLFPVGCGKNRECPDFQPTERSAENRRLLQEVLLSQ